MSTKGYTIKSLEPEVLMLLKEACDRETRNLGYKVSLQAYLRKLLNDAANAEKALQEAAAREYAQQQSEDAQS